ncbi:MAG: PQQ-binding-like beta-propeller repeat protein [Planctomycetaceae bacterium]
MNVIPATLRSLFAGSCLLFCGVVSAGDWPQILGPSRNGTASAEALLPKWDSELTVLWESPVGSGFAGAAVSGERAVMFFRNDESEIVRCVRVTDGKMMWEAVGECHYRGGVSSDKGPRCVPLISEDRVYVLGVEGLLRCLRLSDGQEVWKQDLQTRYNPLAGYFGVGSTPVIHDQHLIVNVGGRGEDSIVAFDINTGEPTWKAFDDSASYSSPVIASVDGEPIAIVVTRLNLVGLDPQTGSVRFSFPFGARGPTVNGATPIITGESVFVSASYHIGSLLVQLPTKTSAAREIWRDADLLATQYATPVAAADHSEILFAVDGRQDGGPGSASVRCLDVKHRKVLWEQTGFDYGTLVRVSDELLLLTCGGDLYRLKASVDGYQEVARRKVQNETDRGYRLPALANGRLFVRDDDTLKCLHVGTIQSPVESR